VLAALVPLPTRLPLAGRRAALVARDCACRVANGHGTDRVSATHPPARDGTRSALGTPVPWL
jgi:hypothetical protein